MGKGLDAAVEVIKDKFGKAAIMRFSDTAVDRVPVIPSTCLSFDIATGIGGIPRRRISEIFGPTGGGKTTFALHVVSSAQKIGLGVAYIDSENALDEAYAKTLGVDTGKMFISQPDNGEQGLEIAEICIRSGEIGLVVVDSVDALVPIAMIEGEMGDRHVGLLARLMSQAMRKLTAIVRKANCALVLLNQERNNINTTGYAQAPTFTSGGVAVKYYSSMRVNVKSIGAIKDGDKQVGQKTLMKIVKNKCAPPFKTAEVDLIFGQGLSLYSDILDLAIETRLVDKAGAWYSYGNTRLGNGRDRAAVWLSENEPVAEELRQSIRVAKGLEDAPEEADESEDET